MDMNDGTINPGHWRFSHFSKVSSFLPAQAPLATTTTYKNKKSRQLITAQTRKRERVLVLLGIKEEGLDLKL